MYSPCSRCMRARPGTSKRIGDRTAWTIGTIPAMNVGIASAAPTMISAIDTRRLGPGGFGDGGSAGAVTAPSSPVPVFAGVIEVLYGTGVVDPAGRARPGERGRSRPGEEAAALQHRSDFDAVAGRAVVPHRGAERGRGVRVVAARLQGCAGLARGDRAVRSAQLHERHRAPTHRAA